MKINKKYPLKRVVITGAGSGLGRALALCFAAQGWKIAVTDIDPQRMLETAKLVVDAGGSALTAVCDVTKLEDIVSLRDAVTAEWGGADILVNNAGIVTGGFMEKIPLEDWDRVLATNLDSIIYGCRTFIPLFKEQGYGYIVNVASGAGIASLPEMMPYNVSKAGAISISETLKIELGGRNIGVTVVCPSFFKTNLLDRFTSTDARQEKMAHNFFAKSGTSADMVARHVMRRVNRGKLYAIRQLDGRALWFFKRHFPESFFNLFAWLYKKGLYDKYVAGL